VLSCVVADLTPGRPVGYRCAVWLMSLTATATGVTTMKNMPAARLCPAPAYRHTLRPAKMMVMMILMIWLGGCTACPAPDDVRHGVAMPQHTLPAAQDCYIAGYQGPCYRGMPPSDIFYDMLRYPENWSYPYSVSPDVERLLLE